MYHAAVGAGVHVLEAHQRDGVRKGLTDRQVSPEHGPPIVRYVLFSEGTPASPQICEHRTWEANTGKSNGSALRQVAQRTRHAR